MTDVGRSPDGSASDLRYEFFTPYHRGFDLVWDFLCRQPSATYSDGILTAKGSVGYERARDIKVFADGQQISHSTELWGRFAAPECWPQPRQRSKPEGRIHRRVNPSKTRARCRRQTPIISHPVSRRQP